ncbi:MAG: hypothetical protein ACT4PV_12340 [Planctomycetaceae bacterium]
MRRGTTTLKSALVRAARLKCPACGIGGVYRGGLRRAGLCSHCGWRFERCEGHWVGGSELHMFAVFGLSALLFLPLLFVVGFSPRAMAAVIGGNVLLSLAVLRWSRPFFLALDYLLDPPEPDSEDGFDPLVSPPLPAAPRADRQALGLRDQ